MTSLPQLLLEKKVLICCGAGGVGKTTVSAALALQAAAAGRKTLVCTIDPARRLADSLGLKKLGNEETKIPNEVFEQNHLELKGELWGMMLDSKRTFDELIERIAVSRESYERIMGNHYYQTLTSALAGSQEFSAMEKLYELWDKGKYDLIVLDTPPTKHALDFLDAPKRMSTFLDGKVVQWFVKPYLMAGKMGFKFVQRSAGMLFKILEMGTGYEVMADLAEFFLAFDGMYDGFKKRAVKVRDLLAADQSAFVLVTSPQTPAITEAKFFFDRLAEEKMPLGAVVFNRVHQRPVELSRKKLDQINDDALSQLRRYAPAVDALMENLKSFVEQADADRQAILDFLGKDAGKIGQSRVPHFDSDVHDVKGLMEVGEYFR